MFLGLLMSANEVKLKEKEKLPEMKKITTSYSSFQKTSYSPSFTNHTKGIVKMWPDGTWNFKGHLFTGQPICHAVRTAMYFLDLSAFICWREEYR